MDSCSRGHLGVLPKWKWLNSIWDAKWCNWTHSSLSWFSTLDSEEPAGPTESLWKILSGIITKVTKLWTNQMPTRGAPSHRLAGLICQHFWLLCECNWNTEGKDKSADFTRNTTEKRLMHLITSIVLIQGLLYRKPFLSPNNLLPGIFPLPSSQSMFQQMDTFKCNPQKFPLISNPHPTITTQLKHIISLCWLSVNVVFFIFLRGNRMFSGYC